MAGLTPSVPCSVPPMPSLVTTDRSASGLESCSDSDAEECWICLGSDGQLVNPCACPRVCHRECMAQWQLVSYGRREENYCRFCSQRLPALWKQDPELASGAKEELQVAPVMAVRYNGPEGTREFKLRVKPGPEGLAMFKAHLKDVLGFEVGPEFDVTFECQMPATGSLVTLSGLNAYGAATHCAALLAATKSPGASSTSTTTAASSAAASGSTSASASASATPTAAVAAAAAAAVTSSRRICESGYLLSPPTLPAPASGTTSAGLGGAHAVSSGSRVLAPPSSSTWRQHQQQRHDRPHLLPRLASDCDLSDSDDLLHELRPSQQARVAGGGGGGASGVRHCSGLPSGAAAAVAASSAFGFCHRQPAAAGALPAELRGSGVTATSAASATASSTSSPYSSSRASSATASWRCLASATATAAASLTGTQRRRASVDAGSGPAAAAAMVAAAAAGQAADHRRAGAGYKAMPPLEHPSSIFTMEPCPYLPTSAMPMAAAAAVVDGSMLTASPGASSSRRSSAESGPCSATGYCSSSGSGGSSHGGNAAGRGLSGPLPRCGFPSPTGFGLKVQQTAAAAASSASASASSLAFGDAATSPSRTRLPGVIKSTARRTVDCLLRVLRGGGGGSGQAE